MAWSPCTIPGNVTTLVWCYILAFLVTGYNDSQSPFELSLLSPGRREHRQQNEHQEHHHAHQVGRQALQGERPLRGQHQGELVSPRRYWAKVSSQQKKARRK